MPLHLPAGFLSHEPLLVAWGHRGGRAQRASAQAKSRLIIQLAIALIACTMALLLASMPVRFALLGCLSLAVVSFVVALQGLHRSLPGQLWGVVSLSAPSVPILLAGDLPTETAFTIWLIWLLGFAATTVAVRGVIASQKRQSRAVLWAVLVFVSLAALVSQIEGFASVLAVTPMVLPSWYLMLAPPSPKHLKRVGWILVGATLTKAFWSRSSFEGV